MRDRSNLLDIYRNEELMKVFRFCSRDKFEGTEELPLDLPFVSDCNAILAFYKQSSIYIIHTYTY